MLDAVAKIRPLSPLILSLLVEVVLLCRAPATASSRDRQISGPGFAHDVPALLKCVPTTKGSVPQAALAKTNGFAAGIEFEGCSCFS